MPGKISFGSVLAFVAVLYTVGFFMTGQLLTQLPTNWFIGWLGGIFRLMDDNGFLNVWSGLNPGAHYLYFLVWKPAQIISGEHWSFAITFSLLWYVVSVGAVFLGAYLFYKIMEHIWGEGKATILGIVYLVLFLTFEWFTVIDSIAIAALLGAIYCSFKGSGKLGGLLLAISAVIKPIGAVVLFVLMRSEFLPRKAKAAFVGTFAAAFSALLLPFALGNFKIFMSPFNWQSGRAPWETVYAFFMWLGKKPLPTDPFFQDYSGIAQRDWGWTGITPVHSVMTTPVPGYDNWYSTLSLVLLAVALMGFLFLKRVRTENDMLWGSLCVIGIYFTFFYGWSGQFFFWLAPFLLAVFPLAVTASLKIVGWLIFPFFYSLYLARVAPDLVVSAVGMPASWTASLSSAGAAGYWSLIILRTVFILVLSVIAWKKLPVQLWNPVSRLIPDAVNVRLFPYKQHEEAKK